MRARGAINRVGMGMTSILLTAGALIAGWVVVGRRLLLGWYLREVRRLDVRETPDDAIITYPLA